MKTAIYLLLIASCTLYYPFYPAEEFEAPKAISLITFGIFSFLSVSIIPILLDRVAQYLLLFIGSAALSTGYSINPHLSVFGNPKCNNGLLVHLSYFVLYLTAAKSLIEYKDRMHAVRIILALSFIISVYAILQVLGIDFKSWNGVLYEHGYMRPISFLGHPNFMAATLSMMMPFIMWRIDFGRAFEKVFAICCIVITTASIILSQSRGMWVACILGLLTYKVMIKASMKNMIKTSAFIIAMVLSVIALTPSFRHLAYERTHEIFTLGKDRTEYFKGAIRIWKRYPVLGIGLDAFEPGFQHQRSVKYWNMQSFGSPHRAHNEFLNILATQGVLGALCVLLLIGAILKRIKDSTSEFVAPATAAIVVFFIQDLSSFHVISTGVIFILCLTLLKQEFIE